MNEVNLTDNLQTNDLDPAMSADGKLIVYSSDASGDDELWMMNFDGTGQMPLSQAGVNGRHPFYSPDGSAILFPRRAPGEEVFVIDADGTGETQLSDSGAEAEWRR